jgi:hypothetical protein
MSIDYLDRSTPVPVVKGNDFFDQLCRGWERAETVTELLKREAEEKARYAASAAAHHIARIADQRREQERTFTVNIQTGPQPVFTPKSIIADTTTIPVIRPDRDPNTDSLIAIWDEEATWTYTNPLWSRIKKAARTVRDWFVVYE